MGRFVAIGAIAIVFGVEGLAFAADDDLALDLGGGSEKVTPDGGAGLRKLELHRIQRGTFVEGSPASDSYREPDEIQRNVTLTKPFWMGKYPVTRAQFARFVSETRFQTDAEKGQSGGFGWDGIRLKQAKEYTWRNPGFVQTEDDPVTLVTFGDANAFTAWASRKTGRRVRLPTEAEYEFAARGGTTTPWYNAKTEEDAATLTGWFRPQPGAAVGTHPVGRKKPNPLGLFDMSGNVNEWTLDVYAPWTNADAIDPTSTTNGSTTEPERRVLRGGSWMRDPRKGRSASRSRNTPGTRNADNGFRVVVEEEATPAPAATPTTAGSTAPPTTSAVPPPSELPSAVPLQIAPPVVQRQPTEGIGWGFFAAPFGAVAFVIAWMFARRKKPEGDAPAKKAPPVKVEIVVPTPAKIEPYRPSAAQPNPRSPWPSDQMKAAHAIPASERALPSGPPAPLSSAPAPLPSGPPAPSQRALLPVGPEGLRHLPSGPPAPTSSARSVPPAPGSSGRGLSPSATPPPVVSGPPAPLVSTPPAPPVLSDLPGPRSDPPGPRSSAHMMIAPPPLPSGPQLPPEPLSSARILPSGPPAPLSHSRVPPALPQSERSLSAKPPAPLSSSRLPPALPSASRIPPAPPSSMPGKPSAPPPSSQRSLPPAAVSGPPPPPPSEPKTNPVAPEPVTQPVTQPSGPPPPPPSKPS